MDETGGWVRQTVPVSLLMMAGGLFVTIYGSYIARLAWTKSADEYWEWLIHYKKIDRGSFWLRLIPKRYAVWNDRLLSIVGIVLAASMAIYGAYNLWRNIAGQ